MEYLGLFALEHVGVHEQVALVQEVVGQEIGVDRGRVGGGPDELLVVIEHLEKVGVRVQEVARVALVAGDHRVASIKDGSLAYYWQLAVGL